MKTPHLINNKRPAAKRSFQSLLKGLSVTAMLVAGGFTQYQAQTDTTSTVKKDSIVHPSWWFGVVGGANFNFYDGSTHRINSDLISPAVFHKGNGIGLFLGPLVEYYKPSSRFGFMFQAGYDNRRGTFKSVNSPCNCPNDLSTKLSYVTIEPSLRFAPFKGDFYLFAGPRFAFNLNKSFLYQQRANPDYPEQADGPEIAGDFSDIKSMIISMQVGAGYDIHLSPKDNLTQVMLAPFVSFHPYFGQEPREIETWNITTLRAGLALKFGRGHKVTPPEEKAEVVAAVPAAVVGFTVNAPENVPVERRIRETFPLRNYVFFDKGSKEIPDRYVLLEKDEVKEFKEEQLEVFKPKKLSGRADRQMTAYYNVLNIVGDRMGKNPNATIVLVGSSEEGAADGKAMSESVKKYLVDVFGIKESRIKTEGNAKPKVPSGLPGSTTELEVINEGNRRVSIESTSPAMLMEFQSGPDAPLKPVEIVGIEEAPIDSYVTFEADGGSDEFESWSLDVKDEDGKIQYYGPFTQSHMAIPGKSFLGTRPQGDFIVTMVGKTKSGKTVRKETPVHMVLWTPPQNEEGMRYSVIFEYNESKSSAIYEKYLSEVVAPKIRQGSRVIIHGHTDKIGEATNNQKISLARAKDVHGILRNSTNKAGTKDVKFEVYGFGEDDKLSPYGNTYPEERFYNRTVVIDIIPKK